MAEKLTLTGFRNETWNPTIELAYTGAPLTLTGATVALQFRLYPGAADPPLIDLVAPSITFEDVAANSEEIASGYATAATRFLRIYPVVAEGVMQALPTGLNEPEPGEPDIYTWDVVFTLDDGTKWNAAGGEVWIAEGVTE